MHRRGNHACSFLFDKYHHLSYVAIVTAPSLVFPRGPCVVGGDLKRVVEAPNDVYHAHVRALAARSNQNKSFKRKHTSEEFLEKPVAWFFFSVPLGSVTKT